MPPLILGTPLERFENQFAPLLGTSRGITRVVDAAFVEHYPHGVPGDDMPAATAARMLLAVDPMFHAAVKSLSEADTTLGALALMRPIIEAWAHLYFILGSDNGYGAACRAIRVERGWAGQSVGVARESGIDADIQKAAARLADIEAIAMSRKCTGGPRDYGDTGTTVSAMTATLAGADWLPGALRSSSQMVHVGGWDWSLIDRGDGVSVLQLPPPSHRAARLHHLTTIYFNVAIAALELTRVGRDSDSARAIQDAATRVRDSRFLGRAIDGDYD